MKREKLNRFFIWLFIIIFISNIPPVHTLFSFFLDSQHYRYSNYNGDFTFIEFKGHDTNMMYRRFNYYKNEQLEKTDKTLYRIFRKNPLTFWRWIDYFYDRRYNFPYKSWKGIRRIRGYRLKHSNNLQDF